MNRYSIAPRGPAKCHQVSFQYISLCYFSDIVGGVGQKILEVYQANSNLTVIGIFNARLQNGGYQVVAATLRNCTNLKNIDLHECNMSDDQLLSIVGAIRGLTSLVVLNLHNNRIGNTGCEALATLLRDPNSNLRIIYLGSNDIHYDGATTLANALLNNTKLRILNLDRNPINQSVVDIFARLLCNTSSINKIYCSNHTFEQLGLSSHGVGYQLDSLLQLNRYTNKSHVAIKKILNYHPNIDMEPLFEWNMEGEGERDMKALPYVVAWFERAGEAVAGTVSDSEESSVDEGEANGKSKDCERYKIDKRKLTAMYQFAQAMPLLFVTTSHMKGGDNKRKRDESSSSKR